MKRPMREDRKDLHGSLHVYYYGYGYFNQDNSFTSYDLHLFLSSLTINTPLTIHTPHNFSKSSVLTFVSH
jgi:hypothetical protein